jgi:hypothetical protein
MVSKCAYGHMESFRIKGKLMRIPVDVGSIFSALDEKL